MLFHRMDGSVCTFLSRCMESDDAAWEGVAVFAALVAALCVCVSLLTRMSLFIRVSYMLLLIAAH